MFTRREAMLAALAAVPASAAVSWGQSSNGPATTIMHSSAFDWDKMEVQTNKAGEKRQVFDTPVSTLDRLECHITTLKPGEEAHPPHRHPEEEMMFIKEGTLDVTQNGKTQRVGAGSVTFNAANELHGARNVGETPATYFVIKWWSPGTEKAATKG
jgi:XRE family transcriptional regulator, regulator of sulfur utilization